MIGIPEVHPLNFALRYTPPTLVMHYYLGKDQKQEFAHQVKVFLKNKVTASQIVNELVREEPLYFGPSVVPREQLERLVQRLIDNNGRKVASLKLEPKYVPKKEPVKEQPKEPAPKPKEQQLQKELRPKEPVQKAPSTLPARGEKEAKKVPEVTHGRAKEPRKDEPVEVQEAKGFDVDVEDIKPEIKPETKKGQKGKPAKEEKASPISEEAFSSPEENKSGGSKKKKNIRERFGLGHIPEAKASDILVEDERPEYENNYEDNPELDERFVRKQHEEYGPGDYQEEGAPNEEEVIVGETGEGDGNAIVLQKVMIQDLNQEFLMDEQGNLYDMEGHYVGKVDEGAEEGEEDPGNEGLYYEEGDPNDGSPEEGGRGPYLPEIPPFNPKNKKRAEGKRSHSP